MAKTYSATEMDTGAVITAVPPKRSPWSDLTVVAFFAAFLLFKLETGKVSVPHLLFATCVPALYFASSWTRKFFVIGIPMIVYGLCFDSFQYIPFRWLQPIHVQDLFHWDEALVGALFPQSMLPLHEWLYRTLAHPCFDLLCALFYGMHLPMAVLVVLILLAKQREGVTQRYSTAFGLLNIMAFLTFFLLPAAAPWYVQKFGFVQPPGFIPGDPAGLIHADRILGYPLFGANYHIAPITFGAVPSMHCGWSFLGWLYLRQINWKYSLLWGGYALAMMFSALYLQHHYAIDVVIGVLYAIVAWLLCDKVFRSAIRRAYERLYYACGLSRNS